MRNIVAVLFVCGLIVTQSSAPVEACFRRNRCNTYSFPQAQCGPCHEAGSKKCQRHTATAHKTTTPAHLGRKGLASLSFVFGRVGGDCEYRDGFTLTIYSDGSWRAIGDYHCNTGGITSCQSAPVTFSLRNQWDPATKTCGGATLS